MLRFLLFPIILISGLAASAVEPNSLKWPVQVLDIAQLAHEYQSSLEYFHGGLDLRVPKYAVVRTPVSGRINARYYNFNIEGGFPKFYTSDDNIPSYYEISVTTKDGYVFLFHHLDAFSITDEVRQAIKSGLEIKESAILGTVISWDGQDKTGSDYTHLHYVMLSPRGNVLNPLYFSKPIPDTIPPRIHNIFEECLGCEHVSIARPNQRIFPRTKNLVVSTRDYSSKGVYPIPPCRVLLSFDNGAKTDLDFCREMPLKLDLFGVFPRFVLTKTEFYYNNGEAPFNDDKDFLFRLPLPNGATGPFTIEVFDVSGNKSYLRFPVGI